MYYFFVIDKMASRATFGPRAVVWRPLLLYFVTGRTALAQLLCSQLFKPPLPPTSCSQLHFNLLPTRPFRCTNPNCVRSFASEAQLTNHSASCCARSHSGPDQDQQHQCDSCGRPFKSRHLLQRHVACVHLKLKPFKCDQCGRAFGRKEMLKQHRAAHTGRRDYVCGVCEKSFRQSASLYMHKLQHSGEKDICGQRESVA